MLRPLYPTVCSARYVGPPIYAASRNDNRINDMAGFMSSLWGRKDTQQVSRDAIVGLRQQLQMIEKKEEYTQKKVEEELAKAKANAVTNKAGMFIQTSLDKTDRFGSLYDCIFPMCIFV